ncbi:MAG: phage terminase large subunit [Brevinema sp.]
MNKNNDEQQRALRALLRNNLAPFVEKVYKSVDNSQPYIHSDHIELIADRLEQCYKGKIKRLIINMPPRSLKSICTSVAFPAWILGKDPKKRIISVSYSDELASKHARDCRAVMDARWYKELFPLTRINPNKRTETEYETTKNGYRLATSVGGTLTGRGGNLIIIDDPIKPQDALSETKRKSVNQWYANTLYSRLDNKNTDVIIIVMQRVHTDDLCGFVQDSNTEWNILNLPAIATKDEEFELSNKKIMSRRIGEILNPQLESQFILENIKKNMGSYNFEAQYQQNPIPEDGGLLKWKWFDYHDELPSGDMIVQSWDTASSDNDFSDYSVGITALYKDNKFYIIDIFRDKLLFPELKRKIKELHDQYKPKKLIIENKASGIALIQQIRNEYNIYPIPYDPKLSKKDRIMVNSGIIESGRVLLPRGASFIDELQKEVVTFPHGKHDDQLDALSQILDNIQWFHHETSRSYSFSYNQRNRLPFV